MKKFLVIIVSGFISLCSSAQTLAERGINVSNVNVVKNDSSLFVSMQVDPAGVKVKTNQKVVLTPILMGEGISKKLPGINLSGRNSWFRYLRNEKNPNALKNVYRQKRKDSNVIDYQVIVHYEEWMSKADLMLEDSRCGCLNKVLGEKQEEKLLAVSFVEPVFVPQYVFITPEAEEKMREATGTAYIDYPVNETVIRSDYRNNRIELQKIYNTVDSIRNNPDAEITAFSIKGFASPEGPYEGNVKLAKARTASLLAHIRTLTHLPEDIMEMDYEPEDWEGLRRFVEQSALPDKEAILKIIDGPLPPDARNWKIHAAHPAAYRYLLDVCYPGLRHSDYTVSYTIRAYTDIEEARRILKQRPGNLSLHEFNMVANSYEEGSDEYEEVFDIMVRLYPEDRIANLNAANVSMKRGDMVSAEKFLLKAGDVPEAVYARAVYMALAKNYEEAANMFQQAAAMGLEAASAALEQINSLIENNNKQ